MPASRSMICATSSPSTSCSVKFFDPTIMPPLVRRAATPLVSSTMAATNATAAAAARRRGERRRTDNCRSTHCKPASTVSARSAARIAPARMTVVSTMERPR